MTIHKQTHAHIHTHATSAVALSICVCKHFCFCYFVVFVLYPEKVPSPFFLFLFLSKDNPAQAPSPSPGPSDSIDSSGENARAGSNRSNDPGLRSDSACSNSNSNSGGGGRVRRGGDANLLLVRARRPAFGAADHGETAASEARSRGGRAGFLSRKKLTPRRSVLDALMVGLVWFCCRGGGCRVEREGLGGGFNHKKGTCYDIFYLVYIIMVGVSCFFGSLPS